MDRRVGTFHGLVADSVRLDSLLVPLGAIYMLDVSRGRSSATLPGLGIGLVGGAFLGFVFADPTCTEGYQEACRAAVVLGGGLAGMLIGGTVGAFVKREKWASVKPESLIQTAGLITGPGIAFGIRLRWH